MKKFEQNYVVGSHVGGRGKRAFQLKSFFLVFMYIFSSPACRGQVLPAEG